MLRYLAILVIAAIVLWIDVGAYRDEVLIEQIAKERHEALQRAIANHCYPFDINDHTQWLRCRDDRIYRTARSMVRA